MSLKRSRKQSGVSADSQPPSKKAKTNVSEKENEDQERHRILHLLKNNEEAAAILASELVKRIEAEEDFGDLMQLLGSVFPANQFKLPEYRHCVRCHEKFDVNDKNSRCTIPHSEEFDDYEAYYDRRTGTKMYRLTTECCGFEFETSHPCGAEAPGYCFKGKHTLKTAKVAYNDCNIVRCGEYGCHSGKDCNDNEQ